MRPNVLMKCGHAANATLDDKPVCAICYGLKDGANLAVAETPNLEGRKSRCWYCNKLESSSVELPYFAYRPEAAFDSYYCGCHGWN